MEELWIYIAVPFYAKEMTSRKISPFLVQKMTPLATNYQVNNMMLQLKVTHGSGWSDKDYNEAVKKGIKTPNITYELGFQIKNTTSLSAFFFNHHSIITRNILKFRVTIKKYTLAFEASS